MFWFRCLKTVAVNFVSDCLLLWLCKQVFYSVICLVGMHIRIASYISPPPPPPKKKEEKKEETIPCSVQDAHYPYLIILLVKFCCQRTMLGKAEESTEETCAHGPTYRSMHNLTLDDADRADLLSEILGLPVKPCKLDPPSLTLRPVGLLITKRVHVVYSSTFMSSTKNMNTL